MPRAVFYSMGGGLGHLNRSLAVIRQLRRETPHLEPLVMTNSPFCHLALATGVPVLRLPGAFERKLLGAPALSDALAQTVLDTLGPSDVLVVDAIPEQLSDGFLASLSRGRYLKAFIYRNEVAADPAGRLAHFDQRFYPFPAALAPRGLSPEATACGYIVGRQPQDVLTREQARLRLGLAPDGTEPVVLAFHACSPAETMALFRQVQGASEQLGVGHSLRLSTPQVLPGVEYFYPHLVSLYPVMDVLPAADLVVCAGGYNAYAEVGSLNAKAIFRPIDRSHDAQHDRVRGYPTFEAGTPTEALAGIMREALAAPKPPRRFPPSDYHGAEAVATAIANAMAVV